MPTTLSKTVIPTARKKNRQFRLPSDHVTTQDFFQLQPVFIKPLMPGESINLNLSCFSRLLPMIKPTFGNMKINNRVFIVPYRQLWHHWNEFINDTSEMSQFPTLTRVTNIDLFRAINNAAQTVTAYPDYSYRDESGNVILRKHTKESKYRLKILNSLGYQINLGVDLSAGDETPMREYLMKHRNALPLLAYAKIFYDWYSNSQYRSNLGQLLGSLADSIRPSLDASSVERIFQECELISLEKDYFIGAWDNPNSPTQNNEAVKILDPSLSGRLSNPGEITGISVKDGVPVMSGYDSFPPAEETADFPSNQSLTIIHLLHSVTSYLKRHQIVGNRVVDRFFARWGIQLDDTITNRCKYIGSHEAPLAISDVISTADTDGAPLGEYAAKGFAKQHGSGHFSYSNSKQDWAFIVVMSSVTARQSNVSGSDMETMRLDKFDFFTPEFDAVGPEVIPTTVNKENFRMHGECTEAMRQGRYGVNKVFGFLPRYASYKVMNDKLTGDFNVNTLRTDLDCFHTMRQIGDSDFSLLYHSEAYCFGRQEKMDKIFNMPESYYDHFISVFHFDVVSSMPATSLFTSFDFELDDEGRPVTVQSGGSRLD